MALLPGPIKRVAIKPKEAAKPPQRASTSFNLQFPYKKGVPTETLIADMELIVKTNLTAFWAGILYEASQRLRELNKSNK